MVETTTIADDAGKRCSNCGKDIYRFTTTWWIARHGEYCSKKCGEQGAADIEAVVEKLEKEWKEGRAQ